MAGAPLGNKNAAKAAAWTAAINRALEHRSRVRQVQALDELAEKLLENCEAGDMTALKELGDRLEGRPAQSVTVSGDADNPLTLATVELVRANKDPVP